MKKLLLALSLLLAPSSLLSQNVRYDNTVQGPRGPVGNQNVAVCTQPANTSTTPCSPLATIFSSASGAAQANPITATSSPIATDQFGNFHFYIAPGVYTVQIYGAGIQTPYVLADQSIGVSSSFGGAVSSPQVVFGTGSNTLGGDASLTFNSTTKVLSTPSVDNIIYLDGVKYPCTDAGITAAETAIFAQPSGRGIIDASSCVGSPTLTIANPIVVGQQSSAKPLKLILPPGTTRCTFNTPGSPCLAVTTSSSLACPGVHGASYCFIDIANTASVLSIVKTVPDNITNVVTHVVLEGIDVENDQGGTISASGAIVEIVGCEDCQTYNLTVSPSGSRGLWIHDGGASDPSNSVHLYGTLVNGNQVAGSRPVVIEANTNSGGTAGTQFFGYDFGHPGPGNFILEVNGHNAGGLTSTQFYGGYMESNNAVGGDTTDLIRITDANSTEFGTIFLNRIDLTSTATGISLTESSGAKTYGTVINNFSLTGGTGTCTNALKDAIPGEGGNLSFCQITTFSPLSSETANISSRPGVILTTSTVSGLPTCNASLAGNLRYVTDATAPTYNAALTGGGAIIVPVFCNGSAWTSH